MKEGMFATGEQAERLKSIFREKRQRGTLTSEQLKNVLLSVGAPASVIGCLDQLVQAGGLSGENQRIQFEAFIDFLFAEDRCVPPSVPLFTADKTADPASTSSGSTAASSNPEGASHLNSSAAAVSSSSASTAAAAKSVRLRKSVLLCEDLQDIQRKVAEMFTSLGQGKSQIDADFLVGVLLHLGETTNHGLTEESLTSVVREFDVNGDGVIGCEEVSTIVYTPLPPPPDFEPHLVLYFDINQTVLMTDTVTSSSTRACLNEVVANAAWGRILPDTSCSDGARWERVSSSPALHAPEEGLSTYCQFVRQNVPKNDQRKTLRRFAEPGAPGELFSPYVDQLLAALELPAEAVAAAEPGVLEELGLGSGKCCLLPSFLLFVRWLKKSGRSFSLCFRTFGLDLKKIEQEFNALCENRHPLFARGCNWAHDVRHSLDSEAALSDVVLDGSDGGPDMRLDLSPGGHGCGSWIRGSDDLHVVLGDLRQPPPNRACASDLPQFYADDARGHSDDAHDLGDHAADVDILIGADAVRDKLRELLHERGAGRTLALRDYFPAWESSGRCASNGKPLFLESNDTSVFQVFWDDHILPKDAHIVDIRHADAPGRQPPPIGAVSGVHIVRAEPISSITDPMYFIKSLQGAEEEWRARCQARQLLAQTLEDVIRQCRPLSPQPGLERRLSRLSNSQRYTTHTQLPEVLRATDCNVSDDVIENLVSDSWMNGKSSSSLCASQSA